MSKRKRRPHTDTKLTLAPLTVDEALKALLQTPPPPKATATREGLKKKQAHRKGR